MLNALLIQNAIQRIIKGGKFLRRIIIIILILILSFSTACNKGKESIEKVDNKENPESRVEDLRSDDINAVEKTVDFIEEKKTDELVVVAKDDEVHDNNSAINDPKLVEFKGILNDINNYDKVIELLDKQLPIVGDEVGQEIIDSYIEYRDRYILSDIYKDFRDFNIYEKLNRGFTNDIVLFLKNHDINQITDKELKDFVIKIRKLNITSAMAEGDIYFEDDFTWYYKYRDYLSPHINDYLQIKVIENSEKALDDAAVRITWNEIYDRHKKYEDYLEKYTDSKYREEIMKRYDFYLHLYLRGIDNTPAFDLNAELNNELRKSYLQKSKYGEDGVLNRILALYIPILEKNNYIETKEVKDFLDEVFTKNSKQNYFLEGSNFKGGYGFFREGIFYPIDKIKEMSKEEVDKLNISESQIRDMMGIHENTVSDKRFAFKILENSILEVSIIDRVTDMVEYAKTFTVNSPSIEDKVSRYNSTIYLKTKHGDGNRLITINGMGEAKELYSGRHFSYLISPDQEYIALNEDNRIIILDINGEVLYEYKDIFDLKDEAEGLNIVKWSADSTSLWINKRNLSKIEAFYKINIKEVKYWEYDVRNLGFDFDYDLNANNGKIAYSNYPMLFDVWSVYEFENSNDKVSLYIYDLEEKTDYFVCDNIAKSFEPKWINDSKLEYYSASTYIREIIEINDLKDIFGALKTASLGNLKIGMTAMEVINELGECQDKGDKVVWGADALQHQDWNYNEQGISFDMTKEEGHQIVNSIHVTSPFMEKTDKGIGVGSTKYDVLKAYEEHIDLEESNDNRIVVGSIYGGIFFRIENGEVSSIFIGAGAE